MRFFAVALLLTLPSLAGCSESRPIWQRDREALGGFELIRPASELWGFKTATIAGFPAVERKGLHDIFVFSHGADGRWSFTRQSAKVFATDL